MTGRTYYISDKHIIFDKSIMINERYKRKQWVLAALILLLGMAGLGFFAIGTAHAQNFAIIGGKIVTGDGSGPVEGASLLVENGKITAIGRDIAVPPSFRRVDAKGKWVTPGIFAGFSRLGLIEVNGVKHSNDARAANAMVGASLDVQYAINPVGAPIAVARSAGITRALVVPAQGLAQFAGFGAVIDLGQDYDAVNKAKIVQFADLGVIGQRVAGGSRAALYVLLRAQLDEAKRYMRAPNAYKSDVLNAVDAKALSPIISGRSKFLVHVESAPDILQIIQLKRDYPTLDIIIAGANEGWRVADALAKADIPVIANGINNLPNSFQMLGATQSNVGVMHKAGVRVALGMIQQDAVHRAGLIKQYAGNLVAVGALPGSVGLSWGEAFAAITHMPAKILGVDKEYGSLGVGKAADIVIWSNDPLELSAHAERIFIDGAEQSTYNRQSALRDRYRP